MNAILQRLADAAARPFGAPLDFLVLLLLLAAATAWVWLAARASAQAERTGRSPGLHFLLGLLIPFIWPWLMPMPASAPAGTAPVPAEEKGSVPPPAEDAPSSQPAAEPDPAAYSDVAVVEEKIGAGYFQRLADGGSVSPQKPCLVTRDDGSQVTVVGLVEVRDDLVVVSFRNAAGAVQTLRIPYARIRAAELHQD